jgi:hypothetical protein
MRHFVSACFAIALGVAPAVAADSVADQASSAYTIFAGGKSQVDFNLTKYPGVAFADVSGKWVGLNGPAPQTGIETYGADVEKFCGGSAALVLASPDPITLTVTAKPKQNEFKQTYTLIAGATFAEHTDPEAYFAAIGLGPENTGADFDKARALALSFANGVVQIYRPSEDILVITREKGYPTVLARCPA